MAKVCWLMFIWAIISSLMRRVCGCVGVWGGGGGEGREITYQSLHCHHQNDFCIMMGTDESHFNVSITVRDKVTRQVSKDHNF